MIKVGVIGVGYLGQHHARIFSELGSDISRELAREWGHVRLAAVIDSDLRRAEEIAEKYECRAYSDYRSAFGEVDAFSIVTPTTTHYEIAIDCIRAGKNILIEKPITTTLDEADGLIKASNEAGIIVQVGHLERFNPVVNALYPLLENPSFFEAERLSPFLGRGVDVDITLDLMIHDIDVIFSLLSAAGNGISVNPALCVKCGVKDIKAVGERVLTDNIDVAHGWLEFEGGIHARMTASRISPERSRKLKIYQRDSYLITDYQTMEIKRFFKAGSEIRSEIITVDKKEPLKEELKHFLECIEDKSEPKVCAVQGKNALKIAIEIGEKIRERWT